MAEGKIYCGNGKRRMDWLVGISICLDDVPAEFIKTGKNGKRYVNLDLCKNKDGADRYGNTHYITVNTWKPEGQQSSVSASEPQGALDSIPF